MKYDKVDIISNFFLNGFNIEAQNIVKQIPNHYYMSNEIYETQNLEEQTEKYKEGSLKSNFRVNSKGKLEKVLYFRNGDVKGVWEIDKNFTTDTIYVFSDIPPTKETKTGYRIYENGACYGYKEIEDHGLVKYYQGNYENEVKSGIWRYLLCSNDQPTILQLYYSNGLVSGKAIEFYTDNRLKQTTKRSEGEFKIIRDTIIDSCEDKISILQNFQQNDDWVFYNRDGEIIIEKDK